MRYECVFCQVKAFEKLLARSGVAEEKKNGIVKEFLSYLGGISPSKTAPEVAGDIHSMIRKSLQNPDPYREVKKQGNDEMLALLPKLRKKVQVSANPLETAVRYSLAGNVIDYGPDHGFDRVETFDRVQEAKLAIDHFTVLEKMVRNAGMILYLGDNAGEIVADKLFLETLGHPNVYYAVRGGPVINDVTLEDARYVKMEELARVVSNGFNAPSTILHESSPEFTRLFDQADVILSKGMGNFEGLLNYKREGLFFLFMVKCPVIGGLIGVETGEFVIMENK